MNIKNKIYTILYNLVSVIIIEGYNQLCTLCIVCIGF